MTSFGGSSVTALAQVSLRLGNWTEFDQASESCTAKSLIIMSIFGE